MSIESTKIPFSELAARRRSANRNRSHPNDVIVQFRVHQGVFRCSDSLARLGLAVVVEGDEGEDVGIIAAICTHTAAESESAPRVLAAATETEIASYAFLLESRAREAHASLLVLQHLASAGLFDAPRARQDAAAAHMAAQLEEYKEVGDGGICVAHTRQPLHAALQGSAGHLFNAAAAEFLCAVTIVGVAFQFDFKRLSVYYRVKAGAPAARYRDLAAALGSHYKCRVWLHDTRRRVGGPGPKPRFSFDYHPPEVPLTPAALHTAAVSVLALHKKGRQNTTHKPPSAAAAAAATVATEAAPAARSAATRRAAEEGRAAMRVPPPAGRCEPRRRGRDDDGDGDDSLPSSIQPQHQQVPTIGLSPTPDFRGDVPPSSPSGQFMTENQQTQYPALPSYVPVSTVMAPGAVPSSAGGNAKGLAALRIAVECVPAAAARLPTVPAVNYYHCAIGTVQPSDSAVSACDGTDVATAPDTDDAATVVGDLSTVWPSTPLSPPPAPETPIRVVLTLPQYVPTAPAAPIETAPDDDASDAEIEELLAAGLGPSATFYGPLRAAYDDMRAARGDARAADARYKEKKSQLSAMRRGYLDGFNAHWNKLSTTPIAAAPRPQTFLSKR